MLINVLKLECVPQASTKAELHLQDSGPTLPELVMQLRPNTAWLRETQRYSNNKPCHNKRKTNEACQDRAPHPEGHPAEPWHR